MDNLRIFEQTTALKKLREEYDQQLKLLGVDICDLTDECTAKLNECIELKTITKLHDLSPNFLEEFYYTKKKEQIEHELAAFRMKNELRELEEQIEAETNELTQLQKESVSKRLVSEAEMENNKIAIEEKIQDLVNRQKTFVIPDDINIEELINKLELLEKRNKK